MLNQEELKQYNRHLILEHVGPEGQAKLKAAKVLVIGAGGLGCPVLQYLVAAGVGTIGIVDFDTVDRSNLQRQILFSIDDLGKNKAVCAAEKLERLNPHVLLKTYPERLTTANALDLFAQYDYIVDGTDNFSTRYLVNDAAVICDKPLIYGSIYTFQGQISVFNYKGGPSYRCLFPEPPKEGTIKNCSEIGVLGVLPGVVGTQQANEVLKLILEIGRPLAGRLLLFDALTATYTELAVNRSVDEIEKVIENKAQFATFDYELFCGVNNTLTNEEVNWEMLKESLSEAGVQVIDLRDEWELPALEGENVERITMSEWPDAVKRVSREKKVILVCQAGVRSDQIKQYLVSTHQFTNLTVLKGGLDNYAI